MAFNPDFYPTASGDQGIMLREELYLLLRGLQGDPAMGKWAILRHFDKTRRSIYWDETRNESIGGPPWEYVDIPALCFRTRFTTGRLLRDQDIPTLIGSMANPIDLWFFEWNVLPAGQMLQVDDEIHQIDYESALVPTVPYSYLDRHRIVLVEPHYGEKHGRLEYWGVSTTREVVRDA